VTVAGPLATSVTVLDPGGAVVASRTGPSTFAVTLPGAGTCHLKVGALAPAETGAHAVQVGP